MKQESALNAFFDHLEEYNGFLEKVVEEQNQKIEALLTHDTEVLERSVARQQAISMQMSVFEDRRLQLQAQAGLKGLTFTQIEERLGPGEGQRVRSCRTRMQDLVSQIRFLNDRAMRLVETNLQVLNLRMPLEERVEAQGYDGKGKQSQSSGVSSIFETKI